MSVNPKEILHHAVDRYEATLGGLAHYSWVFSAYLLTSTASVPIWGRLSDLYGRRPMYLIGVALFLVGSVCCGAATSMGQLIAARLLQGLGAGAIIPMSMTIVGELYTLAERPRVQALFSGVWGVASIAGPLVGGYITDAASWRWVFYVNVPFGFCCLAVVATAYPSTRITKNVNIDWLGAALLFSGISALLIATGRHAGARVEGPDATRRWGRVNGSGCIVASPSRLSPLTGDITWSGSNLPVRELDSMEPQAGQPVRRH